MRVGLFSFKKAGSTRATNSQPQAPPIYAFLYKNPKQSEKRHSVLFLIFSSSLQNISIQHVWTR